MSKKRYQVLIEECRRLLRRSAASLLERAGKIREIWNDPEFKADCKAGLRTPNDSLEDLVADIPFIRADVLVDMALLCKAKEDKECWEAGNLKPLFNKVMASRAESRSKVLKHMGRAAGGLPVATHRISRKPTALAAEIRVGEISEKLKSQKLKTEHVESELETERRLRKEGDAKLARLDQIAANSKNGMVPAATIQQIIHGKSKRKAS